MTKQFMVVATMRAVALSYREARTMSDSQVACTSYGIFRVQDDRCVQNAFAARRPG